ALLACYEAGNLRPSVPEVAARAGVSTRSVHNHFADVEALRSEVAQRQWERHAHLLGPVESAAELVEQRAEFFDAVTPVRRAALLSVHRSPTIAGNLARLDHLLHRQLEATFPGVDADTLAGLEMSTSWDAWNRLRAAQGCSVTHAKRVLVKMIETIT